MAAGKRKKQGGKYYLSVRSIARSVAKAQLKKNGAVHICKKEHACLSPKKMRDMGQFGKVLDGTHRSWFGNHWREVIKGIPA